MEQLSNAYLTRDHVKMKFATTTSNLKSLNHVSRRKPAETTKSRITEELGGKYNANIIQHQLNAGVVVNLINAITTHYGAQEKHLR